MKSKNDLITTSKLAQLLNLSQQALNKWVGKPGNPQPAVLSQKRGSPHLWNLAEVVKWVAGIKADAEELEKLRARKLAVSVKLAEMELAERSGKLIDFETSVQEVENMVLVARNRLYRMCARFAPEVAAEHDPRICQQIMEREVDETLNDLAEYPTQQRKRKGKKDETVRRFKNVKPAES